MSAQPSAQKSGTERPPRGERPAAPSVVERYFEVSLLLMLLTAFGTLATTRRLDTVSVVLVAAALGTKLWSYTRGKSYEIAPGLVTGLSILYVFFFFLDFLILAPGTGAADRLLAATVHLVLFTAVMKAFSARTYRDYGYLATLSFLMMLASAILTVSTVYLIGFTVYVVVAISTFISYELKRAAESAPRLARAESEERPGSRPRVAVEKALVGTTLALAVSIVALASLLFFVIPRYRTGYFTSLSVQADNLSGFSQTVDLGDIRRIKRSSRVVMRVMIEGSPREFQGMKWRGVGLTSFDGQHWFNDNTEETPLSPALGERFVVPRPDGFERRPRRLSRYRVMLAPVSTDVLFAAAVPREIEGHFRLIALDETGSLHNPQHAPAATVYSVVSETGLPPAASLRTASTDYPAAIRDVYLAVPELDPRVAALARQVTSGETNNYDRAAALETYLRANLGYTLDPSGIRPDQPISSFLFEARQGYCEYFAAAMAVMLRTLGIPSRLVNGFQTGSWNRVGKDFMVRARDAHSWVEAYFPDYGWFPFDPTPADPSMVAGGAFDDYLDAINLFWSEWVINYDFVHQFQLAVQVERSTRRFELETRRQWLRFEWQGARMEGRLASWLARHRWAAVLLLLGMAAAFGVVARPTPLAELRFWWEWRFGSRVAAATWGEATLTYQRLLRALAKKGFRKAPSQTPIEFADSIRAPQTRERAVEFTRLYNALRYGRAEVPRAKFHELIEAIKKA